MLCSLRTASLLPDGFDRLLVMFSVGFLRSIAMGSTAAIVIHIARFDNRYVLSKNTLVSCTRLELITSKIQTKSFYFFLVFVSSSPSFKRLRKSARVHVMARNPLYRRVMAHAKRAPFTKLHIPYRRVQCLYD